MKDYLVNVKYIQSTSMIIKAISKKDAIKKVTEVLNKCLNSKKLSNKIFDKEPFFQYKVTRTKNQKKSNVEI